MRKKFVSGGILDACIVGLPFRNKRLIFTIDDKMG